MLSRAKMCVYDICILRYFSTSDSSIYVLLMTTLLSGCAGYMTVSAAFAHSCCCCHVQLSLHSLKDTVLSFVNRLYFVIIGSRHSSLQYDNIQRVGRCRAI